MILFLFLGLVLLAALTIMLGKSINAHKYKIRGAAGVQRAGYITIGGIEQYIQMRGQDASNPVILMLHGGPGSEMASYSYGWQAELERAFTILHWDQRGCGNTYYRDQRAEKPTLELLLSDLDELVEHIRAEYDKEKVILMGHSWGTFLGGIYAGRHPEKVSAYLAVGQMLDFKRSEQVSAQEAIRLANGAGKAQDAREIGDKLASVMTYQKLGKTEAAELIRFRQRKEKYLPAQYGDRMGPLRLFSPYMTFSDLRWMLSFGKLIESNSELYSVLLSGPSMSHRHLRYEVPVIIVAGDRDWTTPHCMAKEYFDLISAPGKEFITIPDTGHIPFVDQPRAFTQALLKALERVSSPQPPVLS